MNSSSPQARDMSTALRMAFGPGYGFGGPSELQFRTVVKNTTNSGHPRRR